MTTLSRAAHRAAFLFAAVATLANVSAADVRVYVRYAPGQRAAAQAALGQAQARVHHDFADLGAVAASLPEAARAALARNPAITLVEDDPVRAFLAESIPYGIPMVQAPEAVAAGATGAGIKVGVIDSGVYRGHEDFAGVTITGEPNYGADDQRTWFRDHLSHGTHVVGTIAAAGNDRGVIGVSPGTVSIHMVKVFGDTGNWVYSSDLLAAARAAVNAGSRIVSMSLGGARASVIEDKGLTDLYNKGALLVAAAGNDGTTATSYPAGYASVISVAAIDQGRVVASFSQKNGDVELAAPGVAVLSTVSFTESNAVSAGGAAYAAEHIENSGRATVSADLIYGGLGTATNPAWSGRVVLLDRGTISFFEKVDNVQRSGGAGCIIANNAPGIFTGTLGDGNTATIPAVSISQEDGAALKPFVGSATLTTLVNHDTASYDAYDGTSMATPHVAGVAALVWSKYPGATNLQVRQALTATAQDLGTPGRDSSYGYGLVQAKAALDQLALQNPPPGSGDTTAPLITNVADKVNAKNGSFVITWTTNEAATSDVEINGTLYPDATLTTSHKRTFRGTKGATYTYYVISTDAAGNRASSGPRTVTIK